MKTLALIFASLLLFALTVSSQFDSFDRDFDRRPGSGFGGFGREYVFVFQVI